VCETRDPKGLYQRARAGELTGLTGVDDPYEAPEDAELVLATAQLSPTAAAAAILEVLETRGVVPRSAPTEEGAG
jgi:adenylylsulfate kinase-like enzyme